MRKNKTMRAATLLLALVLITSCFVGGTFAKYTSTATANDAATVAKWSFELNDTEIATTPAATVSFGLFDTINDTGNTADETDVKDNLIAPGTAGSFALKVENLSEVTAKYEINLTATNTSNVPIEYSTGQQTWSTDVSTLTIGNTTGLAIENGTETTIVYWRWVYENSSVTSVTDTTDTALGIAAQTTAPTVTVSATITATQVD